MKQLLYLVFMSNKTNELQEWIQSLLNLILCNPEIQQYVLNVECKWRNLIFHSLFIFIDHNFT